MQRSFSYYIMQLKRWIWVVILGIVVCGGTTYAVSKFRPPVYQATAYLIVNLCSNQTTPYECTSAGVAALPTYVQLLTNPAVLNPVVAQHKGLTLNQLNAMISVKPQTNTQIIELDIQNTDPRLAMLLANEVSRSFFQFSSSQLPGVIQILPAQLPTEPTSPKPLLDAAIGALVGLALALTLIFTFEWISDLLAGPEEVQELLGADTLTIIPQFSDKQRTKNIEGIPALAEGYRILCARLHAEQATKPFKLVMVISALAGEGKSTVAANLATFLARDGKRVLLVDADFRRPVLDRHFQLDNYYGFSKAFLDTKAPLDVELDGRPTGIPLLRVLTTGVLPSNPVGMLQSANTSRLFDYFKTTTHFDYVIFDTPPLLPVADAQILASYVQAAILVVDASKTPRKTLLRAKHVLSKSSAALLGIVINKSKWSNDGAIREYINEVSQPKSGTSTMTLPLTPPVTPQPGIANNGMAGNMMPPGTPPAKGMSMTIPHTPPIEEIDTQNMSVPTTPPMNGRDNQNTAIPNRPSTGGRDNSNMAIPNRPSTGGRDNSNMAIPNRPSTNVRDNPNITVVRSSSTKEQR